MTERAEVRPEDGVVVIELSLDAESGWEILAVLGCLRAGAAALALMPYRSSDVTGMLHARSVSDIGDRIANEIATEAQRVADAREQYHRDKAKAERRGKRT